jgi:D-xylose 1-dehydrogenase (NADP+, D-xylono-1,5-lactone-forming)
MNAIVDAIVEANGASIATIATRGDGAALKADRRLAGAHVFTGSDSYARLVASEEINAVYIGLPNHLHKQWTLEAIRHGKHVLCEKPLGIDAREAVEMVDAAKQANVHLVEAFMYRYNPQHRRVREIIASGELGEVKLVRSGFTVPLQNPLGNVRFGPYPAAGALFDVGVYCVNVARWMFDSEPLTAYASMAELPGSQGDILHSLVLTFSDGRLASLSGGLGQAYESFYEVIGTDGRIMVDRPFATPPFVPAQPQLELEVHAGGNIRREPFPDTGQYVTQINEFVKLLEGQPSLAYLAVDSVANLDVIDALVRSSRSGRAETITRSQHS